MCLRNQLRVPKQLQINSARTIYVTIPKGVSKGVIIVHSNELSYVFMKS